MSISSYMTLQPQPWRLTICIVHLGAQVGFDEDAGKTGGHVEASVPSGVLLERKGVHQVVVSAGKKGMVQSSKEGSKVICVLKFSAKTAKS